VQEIGVDTPRSANEAAAVPDEQRELWSPPRFRSMPWLYAIP
jgi:hypothetical protein